MPSGCLAHCTATSRDSSRVEVSADSATATALDSTEKAGKWVPDRAASLRRSGRNGCLCWRDALPVRVVRGAAGSGMTGLHAIADRHTAAVVRAEVQAGNCALGFFDSGDALQVTQR